MSQNFLDSIMDWLKGNKTPEIQTKIGFEDASLIKTGGILLSISLIFLGGMKLVLDSSLKKYAVYQGVQF